MIHLYLEDAVNQKQVVRMRLEAKSTEELEKRKEDLLDEVRMFQHKSHNMCKQMDPSAENRQV